jgi:predicted RNA-binding protein with PUA-like domain
MKAEPQSRIVKGKDVKVSSIPVKTWGYLYVPSTSKFSVDDFEAVGTTPWEGVRNPEARNLMKEMRVGDKVGFPLTNSLTNVSTRSRFCFITLVAIPQVCT